MDAARALFVDLLRLPVVKDGTAPARGAHVTMLAVGGSYLELIQPVSMSSPFATHIREKGEGLHHIGLWSGDVELEVHRLAEMDVPLADPEPRPGFTGRLSYLEPEAFDGVTVEVVEPDEDLSGKTRPGGRIKRIDHVVLRVPDADVISERFEEYFGIETKRKFERGPAVFAFLRPGDVIMEVISEKSAGPSASSGELSLDLSSGAFAARKAAAAKKPTSGKIAGLAFEVVEIDKLTASLKQKGYPVGEPHPALQRGRIVSVNPEGAFGIPLALIDFTDSPRPKKRGS